MQLDQAWQQLNLVQDFIPTGASNRPGTRISPSKITIHNTDNTAPGADAAAHARYVKGSDARKREVSWHFTVDDKAVFQSLPTNEVGWHAGRDGNRESIGIEICMNAGMNVAAAYERAALLTALMARQLGVSVTGGIVQHHAWTGKNCPRVLRESTNGWSAFLKRVRELHGGLQDVYAAKIELSAVADDCCDIVGKRHTSASASRKKPRKSTASAKAGRASARSTRKPARAKARKQKTA